METLAPEFSKVWLAEQDGGKADAMRAVGDDDAGGLTSALEALANLVTAARSIV